MQIPRNVNENAKNGANNYDANLWKLYTRKYTNEARFNWTYKACSVCKTSSQKLLFRGSKENWPKQKMYSSLSQPELHSFPLPQSLSLSLSLFSFLFIVYIQEISMSVVHAHPHLTCYVIRKQIPKSWVVARRQRHHTWNYPFCFNS